MRRIFARKLVLLLTFSLMGLGFYACSGKGTPDQQQQPDVGALTQSSQTPPASKTDGDNIDREAILAKYAKHVDKDIGYVKDAAGRFDVTGLIGKKITDPKEIERVAAFIANTDDVVLFIVMSGVKIYNRIVSGMNMRPAAAVLIDGTGTEEKKTEKIERREVGITKGSLDRYVRELTVFSTVLQRVAGQDLTLLGMEIAPVAASDLASTVTATLMKEMIDSIESGSRAITAVFGTDATASREEIEEKEKARKQYKERLIGAVNAFGATIVYIDSVQFYLMPSFATADATFTYYPVDKPVSFATAITYSDAFRTKKEDQLKALKVKDSMAMTVSDFTWYTWLEKELELMTTYGREIKDYQIMERIDSDAVFSSPPASATGTPAGTDAERERIKRAIQQQSR